MKMIRKSTVLLCLLCCMFLWKKVDVKAVSNAVDVVMDGRWVTQTIDDDSDILWYRVVVPSDGRLDMTFQAFRDSTYWHFLNEDLNDTNDTRYFEIKISEGSLNAPGSSEYTIYLSKGTYYIKVADNGYNFYGGTGDVRIKTTFTPGNTTETEPNNTWTQAMSLTSGKTVRGMLTALDDREDFYQFQIPKAGKINFKLVSMFESARFDVYSADYLNVLTGKLNRASETAPASGEWSKELAAGTYYIKITDNIYNSDPSGLYEFQWQIDPPEQVTGLTSAKSTRLSNSIVLKWNQVSGADGYRVYKYDSKTKNYVKYKDTSATTLKVTGLSAETRYSFQVAAYKDGYGELVLGEASSVHKAYTAPKKIKATKITAKKVLKKTARKHTIQLKWKKVSGATSYQVYYKSGKSWKLLKKTTSTSLKTTVAKGKTRTYRIIACRTKNKLTTLSNKSNTVTYKAK